MPNYPQSVKIIEVGPRDGLQNEPEIISTSDKLFFIEKLIASGLKNIEVSSFVHPEKVPQLKDAEKLGLVFKVIYDCSKPIIARVQGSAFGGGVGLISVCDIVLAKEDALFALSETRIGLVPGVISPFVIKKTGFANASRYFLTSERFNANKAKEIGLISEIVKDDNELDKKVNELTSTILQNGPLAVSACKKLIRDVVDREINDALNVSKEYIAKCRINSEGQEGMKAFFEKRKPNWSL